MKSKSLTNSKRAIRLSAQAMLPDMGSHKLGWIPPETFPEENPMNLKPLLLIGTLAAMGTLAFAEDAKPASPHTFTGNFSVASNYVFRGQTQTDSKPAVQGGYDYSHACGFYIGVWGSNESWFHDTANSDKYNPYANSSSSLETDLYLGYKFTRIKDVTIDIGAIEYYYPGRYVDTLAAKPHTTEAYLGLSYKWASVKYSHSLSSDFFGVAGAKNTKYIDFTATPSLPYGLTLTVHAGRQAFTEDYSANLSYNDYKVGLGKEIFPTYTLAAAYTYATTKDAGYQNNYGRNIGGSQFALSLTKAF
jgi:uncharacterized protein (TIGR02001 family)